MTERKQKWREALNSLPLIAILRGIHPDESITVAEVLFEEGFEILEVPLNSPEPFDSIHQMARAFPDKFIGAGTATTMEKAQSSIDAGANIVVTPNLDADVARAVVAADVIYCPGVMTPSEAFAAMELGADMLKLFPAEIISPAAVKAIRAVLPTEALLAPVGSISTENMGNYLVAGANGFGIGSSLYKPGKPISDVQRDAQLFVQAYRNSR